MKRETIKAAVVSLAVIGSVFTMTSCSKPSAASTMPASELAKTVKVQSARFGVTNVTCDGGIALKAGEKQHCSITGNDKLDANGKKTNNVIVTVITDGSSEFNIETDYSR